jgi:hypothetical protein
MAIREKNKPQLLTVHCDPSLIGLLVRQLTHKVSRDLPSSIPLRNSVISHTGEHTESSESLYGSPDNDPAWDFCYCLIRHL